MSKTNDTSKLDHANLENRVIADSELDSVNGGLNVGGYLGSLAAVVVDAVFEAVGPVIRAV